MLLDLRLPVDIIEEGEQVEGKFGPALPLTLVQHAAVHDRCRIIQAWAGHHRPIQVPEETRTFLNKPFMIYLSSLYL